MTAAKYFDGDVPEEAAVAEEVKRDSVVRFAPPEEDKKPIEAPEEGSGGSDNEEAYA